MKFKFLAINFIILSLAVINSCSHRAVIKDDSEGYLASPARQIEQLLKNPSLDPAHIGIYIEELETGKIIFAKNEHKLLMPASNMKLVTTASALSLLGPEYKYETEFYYDGEISNGVLNGNLIIKGSGDPVICGRFHGNNPDSIFTLWSKKIKELGINKINGKIIGDNSLYQDDGLGYGWEKDDLPYYYAAKTSSLSFNDNCIDLHFLPGDKIGDPVNITQYPVKNYTPIINEMVTVHKDSSSSSAFIRSYNQKEMTIKGKMKLGAKKDIDWATVTDPADFFMAAMVEELQKNGIQTNKYVVTKDEIDYTTKTLLFVHESVPMKLIVENINKISNNFYAETVLKSLYKKDKVTTKKAVNTEKEFLASFGIDTSRIFIMDGSGLSRHNLVTVHQISTILKYMRGTENGELYKKSLPVGGIDGTLKRRFKTGNAKGHVFAKTGYVGRVRALSGYVEAVNGKEYVFSIIANHYPTPTRTINSLQDQIVTIIYNQNN